MDKFKELSFIGIFYFNSEISFSIFLKLHRGPQWGFPIAVNKAGSLSLGISFHPNQETMDNSFGTPQGIKPPSKHVSIT